MDNVDSSGGFARLSRVVRRWRAKTGTPDTTGPGSSAGGRSAAAQGTQSDGVIDSKVPEVAAHLRQYLATDGRKGHEYHGFPSLLLTTKGRRSGKLFRTPLIYGRDGDSFVVVASNGAKPRNPDWYANLVANPEATVQLKAERFAVTARTAASDERKRLWKLMAGIFPQYLVYEKQTSRDIPVVVLDPRED